jgi:hypothetical protein
MGFGLLEELSYFTEVGGCVAVLEFVQSSTKLAPATTHWHHEVGQWT